MNLTDLEHITELEKALINGTDAYLVIPGRIAFGPWADCTALCEATGLCVICGQSFAPVGRSVAPEANGSYCDGSCEGYSFEARRSFHLWPGEFNQLDRVPPADWVELTQPCDTCDGTGRVSWLAEVWTNDPCPGCKGTGRKQTTFTMACPHDCERFGGRVPGHARGSNWDWVPCWCCDDHGPTYRVKLAVGTVNALLPVRFLDDPVDAVCVRQMWTHDGPQWFLWHEEDADGTPTTLHRDPTDNDYIAHITRINKPC
jgi:hypothetical protein